MIEEMAAVQQRMLGSLLLSDQNTGQETDMRASRMEQLWAMFQISNTPSYLNGAIDQAEAILRRLPANSPDLPVYLNKLSSMHAAEYKITKSAAALDQAVELGLKAKAEAIAMGFPDHRKDVYLMILNGLGCSQSSRFHFHNLHQQQDLDDAIATARQLISMTSEDSPLYAIALCNLTDRLRHRYKLNRDSADLEEALRHLDELVRVSPPGSTAYANALKQLCAMSYSKFTATGSLEHLDNAIRHGESALKHILRNRSGEDCEEFAQTLGGMYGDRYDKKGDLADLRQATSKAEKVMVWTSPRHPDKGSRLWRFLYCAQSLGEKVEDVDEAKALAQTAEKLMAGMPAGDYTKRDACQWLLGDLLTRRYMLTAQIEDLLAVAQNAYKMCKNQNEREVVGGGRRITEEKTQYLARQLERIASAPEGNKIRQLACARLPGYFDTACKTNGIPNASIMLWNQHKHTITLWSDAIEADEDLSEGDIETRAREKEEKAKRAEAAKEQSRKWFQETADYNGPPATGFPGLVTWVDPATGAVLMDRSDAMKEIFGYTDTTPLPVAQFVLRELKLETEARKEEAKRGGHPHPKLCRVCRKVRPLVPRSDGEWGWNEKMCLIPYGNYNQVCVRAQLQCSVCSLLGHILSDDKGTLHPRLAAIDDDVQGLSFLVDEPGKQKTLRVLYGLREVGALKIRELHVSVPRQDISLGRLGRFLAECDTNHGRQCNRQALISHLSPPMSMLHIDVVDECLVQKTSAVKYFALSYVWGKVDTSKTLKSNLASRLMKGGLRADSTLPRTILDAITLVKSLGERFLWVDALCIVQDDDVTKQQNIEQMDQVYSSAFATIVALSGSDAAGGLPGVKPGTRPHPTGANFTVSDRSPTLELNPTSTDLEKIQIIVNSSPLTLTLDSSVWNTRGWTFQERVLSTRCIYIADEAIFFQCRKEIRRCEADHERGELARAPALTVLDNPLHELRRLEERLVDNESGEVGDAPLRVVFYAYKGLVEGYTARELTFPGDVLNAFAGVFSVVRRTIPSGDICGLPGAFLDLALLWTPIKALIRREQVVIGGDPTASDGNGKCPSWSWAGFAGPVEYRLFGKPEDSRPLPTSLVVNGFTIFNNREILTVAGRKEGMGNSSEPMVKVEDAQDDNSLTDYGPNVLQFDAPVLPAESFNMHVPPVNPCLQGETNSIGKQAVYRLSDQNKKQCGLLYEGLLPDLNIPGGHIRPSLVGIAKHGESKVAYTGLKGVHGDIPLFDRSVYESSGVGSGVVDALFVVWGEDGVARRLSVARIHAKAWVAAKPEVRRIAMV